MEDGRITDNQITASSLWDSQWGDTAAADARLNYKGDALLPGAWAAGANDNNQWIQARVHARWITGVMTQGRNGYHVSGGQWVTHYKVQYSNDGTNFTYVMTGNQEAMVSIKQCEFPVSKA